MLAENNIPFTGALAIITNNPPQSNADALPTTSTSAGWDNLEDDTTIDGDGVDAKSQISWDEIRDMQSSGWETDPERGVAGAGRLRAPAP